MERVHRVPAFVSVFEIFFVIGARCFVPLYATARGIPIPRSSAGE